MLRAARESASAGRGGGDYGREFCECVGRLGWLEELVFVF